MSRRLALTPELVAEIHREVPDPGTIPGREPMDDADYAATIDDLLAAEAAQGDIWLFAFGSLLWKPGCPTGEQRPALLRGWRRSFCIRLLSHRGTAERPGLMMGLDRGGAVRGVVQRIAAGDKRQALESLLRREVPYKPAGQPPRWVEVESGGARLPAFVFAMRRDSPFYVGGLTLAEQAEVLSYACGHWGSGAEYLMNTVHRLEQLGIHDRYLWRLQEAVAARIVARRNGDGLTAAATFAKLDAAAQTLQVPASRAARSTLS